MSAPPAWTSLGALLLLASNTVLGQLSIDTPGEPVTESFDIPGSSACTTALTWTDNTTIPNCYSDRPTFYYSNGCANIGGLHVAGTGGGMAFGGHGSNSTTQVRWGRALQEQRGPGGRGSITM